MADPQVDLAVEEATLERLERLAEGQGRIFQKLDRARTVAAVVGFLALLASVLFAMAYFNQHDTIARLEEVTAAQQEQTDQILATRSQARVGLCQVLQKFASGHNRFVEQVVQERLDIIAATLSNPNTPDAQKQASSAFFQAQIDAYKANIVPTYDCSNPSVVADIFKTGG